MNRKLIAWNKYKLPIGTVLNNIIDWDGIVHNQPAKILREVTKEEFNEYYESVKGKNHPHISTLNGLYFYEISTD